MKTPCNICIEEKCEGRHDCDCSACKVVSDCYRKLHPTIRITNRCTQECPHCGFSSHPGSKIMMTIEESKTIAKFLKNNDIEMVNLMGGEFFCNPDWFEIFSNIVSATGFARIVTNGDWASNLSVKAKLSTFISIFRNKVKFSISKDKWHTNKNVELAADFFESAGVKYNVATEKETGDDSIVPVGRAQYKFWGFFSTFGCYCHDPKNMYSFLIDEEGNIYKCGFGIFKYAVVDDYLEGGFDKRFKDYNTKVYKVFITNCASCSRFAYENNNKEYGQIVVKNE